MTLLVCFKQKLASRLKREGGTTRGWLKKYDFLKNNPGGGLAVVVVVRVEKAKVYAISHREEQGRRVTWGGKIF